MIIRTTPEQDARLAAWYRPQVRAHHEQGCEPPGFKLEIELGLPGHYGSEAVAVCGSARLELGQVQVLPDDH